MKADRGVIELDNVMRDKLLQAVIRDDQANLGAFKVLVSESLMQKRGFYRLAHGLLQSGASLFLYVYMQMFRMAHAAPV